MATNNVMLPSVSNVSALQWFSAWIAILLIVGLLARSSWGKSIVYYFVWMAVVVLVLTHASDFAAIINPSQGGTPTNG